MFGSLFFCAYLCVVDKKQQFLAMPELTAKEQTELCMKIQKYKVLPEGAVSSTHVMSLSEYLSIIPFIFSYNSVQVTYNKNIENLAEQVVIVIGC